MRGNTVLTWWWCIPRKVSALLESVANLSSSSSCPYNITLSFTIEGTTAEKLEEEKEAAVVVEEEKEEEKAIHI